MKRLKSSLMKFYGPYKALIKQSEIPLSLISKYVLDCMWHFPDSDVCWEHSQHMWHILQMSREDLEYFRQDNDEKVNIFLHYTNISFSEESLMRVYRPKTNAWTILLIRHYRNWRHTDVHAHLPTVFDCRDVIRICGQLWSQEQPYRTFWASFSPVYGFMQSKLIRLLTIHIGLACWNQKIKGKTWMWSCHCAFVAKFAHIYVGD